MIHGYLRVSLELVEIISFVQGLLNMKRSEGEGLEIFVKTLKLPARETVQIIVTLKNLHKAPGDAKG